MSHHENGREILRSDLESMQGQEAAEDAKQPAENKDTDLPPPPGPAPRKKPTELVTDAVQELYEAEDDEIVEQGKKVVMALRGLRPRPTTYTKIKTGIMYRYQSEEAWTSVKQEIIELDLPEEWAELFRRDGNWGASRGAIPNTAKRQPGQRSAQFVSVKTTPVTITKYSGKRGEAKKWWKDARSLLCDFTPNPSDHDKLKWMVTIKQAMDQYETGRTRIRQLEKKYITEDHDCHDRITCTMSFWRISNWSEII
eukprot:jgi/Bigna1/87824/estExt_fgenesh1_pg.C_240185